MRAAPRLSATRSPALDLDDRRGDASPGASPRARQDPAGLGVDLVRQPRNDDRLVAVEAREAGGDDGLRIGRHLREPAVRTAGDLDEFGRGRAGAERRDLDAAALQLLVQRLGEARGHRPWSRNRPPCSGPAWKAAVEATLRIDAAAALEHRRQHQPAELGQGADVEVDHLAQPLGAAPRRSAPADAEAGIVDQGVDLEPERLHLGEQPRRRRRARRGRRR